MEFKVGDRVKIRENLQEDEGRDGTWVTSAMLDYRGKMATIKWARDNYYRIDLDDEEFAWVGPFFENPLKITLEELEQRIEKLEKEVFKPLTIKDGIKKSLEENLKISLKPSLLTEDERVILRNLDKRWKYLARDLDGELYAFGQKPKKIEDYWGESQDIHTRINILLCDSLFKFIKFEDNEPYNIEELLKGECGNE